MDVFDRLLELETAREARLKRIEDALNAIQLATDATSLEDYVGGKFYKRNTLVVDALTETVYRTLPREGFTSTTLQNDLENGRLKLVGYESQFVTFNHPPTDEEVNALPEDTLVAIYSPSDDPYQTVTSSDNMHE